MICGLFRIWVGSIENLLISGSPTHPVDEKKFLFLANSFIS